MNQELIRIVDGIARDKNIEREQIYTDIEQAIARGLRKHFGTEDTSEFQVQVDRTTGDINAWRAGVALARCAPLPPSSARSGANVSLVRCPAHTRSQTTAASSVSWS